MSNLTTTQLSLLNCIRSSLFTGEGFTLTDEVLREARQQAVLNLIATDGQAVQTLAKNLRVIWEQQEIGKALDGVPYVVIKGTAASVYYPEPLRRTLGDVDIIVSPDNFSAAFHRLRAAGYEADDGEESDVRHAHFRKNGVLTELHRRFASLGSAAQEELLDGWIYEAIPSAETARIDRYTFPMLPDQLNGLVLLTHINQHLESGLGLRQIVDWVMYVDRSLHDEQWTEFCKKTDMLGLTKLAKATARLGQIYLGLSEDIEWCREIPGELVDELLLYIFECGNFGKKDITNNTITMILSHGRGFGGFFRNLQRSGETNWKKCREHAYLKPFAWIYQLFRYINRGLKKSGSVDLKKDLAASRRRNRLMDELEATRKAFRD